MSIIFSKPRNIESIPLNSFCAAFIHQDYYISLLQKCNDLFDLNLLNPDKREIQLRESAYMLISTDPNVINKIDVGVKVRMTVIELCYSKPLKIIVARIHLRSNFTSCEIPHVIIAKHHDMPNGIATGVLDGTFSHMGDFYSRDLSDNPLVIKGRIGLIMNTDQEKHKSMLKTSSKRTENINISFPDEDSRPTHSHEEINFMEQSYPISKYFIKNKDADKRSINELKRSVLSEHDGSLIQHSQKTVYRPEVTHSVQKMPVGADKIMDEPDENQFINHQAQTEETNTIEGTSAAEDGGGIGSIYTGEIYKGYNVIKGPRGGKYIIKNGKKTYVKDEPAGQKSGALFKSGIVYKVNILK